MFGRILRFQTVLHKKRLHVVRRTGFSFNDNHETAYGSRIKREGIGNGNINVRHAWTMRTVILNG